MLLWTTSKAEYHTVGLTKRTHKLRPSFLSFSPRFISWNLLTISEQFHHTWAVAPRGMRGAEGLPLRLPEISVTLPLHRLVCVPGQQGCNRPRGCTQHIPRSHCALRCFENFWSAFAFKIAASSLQWMAFSRLLSYFSAGEKKTTKKRLSRGDTGTAFGPRRSALHRSSKMLKVDLTASYLKGGGDRIEWNSEKH